MSSRIFRGVESLYPCVYHCVWLEVVSHDNCTIVLKNVSRINFLIIFNQLYSAIKINEINNISQLDYSHLWYHGVICTNVSSIFWLEYHLIDNRLVWTCSNQTINCILALKLSKWLTHCYRWKNSPSQPVVKDRF